MKKKKPIAIAPPARQPPFVWSGAPAPEAARQTSADKFLAMHRKELHDRASLLRRLGYSQDEVRSRLEGYAQYEYEPFASSPLRDEVAKVVTAVFGPKSPRTTTLTPGS